MILTVQQWVAVFLIILGLYIGLRAGMGPLQWKSMVFLGSGGHTGEMLLMMKKLDFSSQKMAPPIFVYSEGDKLSVEKTQKQFQNLDVLSGPFHSLPRARKVGQDWLSSIQTSAIALYSAVQLVYKTHPSVLISNGPATGLILLASCLVLRPFGLRTRLIYVESLARVNSLSLSGKIAYHFVDRFIVQWPQLKKKHPRAEYNGLAV